MARTGPIPNRSDDLARDRSRKGGNQVEVTKGVARESVIPDPDPDWDPIAMMLWDSLPRSGQVDFYQQTDWASAYLLCAEVDVYLNAVKYDGHTIAGVRQYRKYRSPEMFKAIQSAMSNLLMTEADRRRVRIELDAPEEPAESAAVLAIADYQRGLEDLDTPEEPA